MKKILFRRNLFNYLEKLEEQDLVRIEHYLKSPFFEVTNRKRVITLFNYLKKQHPNYHNNKKTENETITSKLNFQNINNLKTNLLDAVSNYLQLSGLERNKKIQTFLLADTLDHFKINEFERFTEKAIDNINAKSAKDSNAYLVKYELLLLLYMNKGAKKVGDSNTFLREAIKALNNYFLFESLKALNAYKTNKKHNLNANFFDELNKILKKYIKHFDVDDPNIKIFYLINKGFKISNINKLQKMYFKLKHLTMANWEQLTSETQYEVFTYMMNKAKSLKNRCCPNFKEELFNINKFGIEQGIHLAYSEIDSAMFYNIVLSACDVQEFIWCENFIQKHKKSLPKIEKTDILLIGYAYLFLKQKKYDDAIKNLLLIKSLNTSFEIAARAIELKCMYHIGNYDRFEMCQHRFIRFLNNQKKFNANTIERIKLYIKTSFKLFKAQFPNYKNKKNLIKEIEQTIQTTDNLFQKLWLIEQLQRLKN